MLSEFRQDEETVDVQTIDRFQVILKIQPTKSFLFKVYRQNELIAATTLAGLIQKIILTAC